MRKPEPIPFRLTIGVTGHRQLNNSKVLKEKVKIIIDEILAYFPPSEKTNVLLRVISPLAEGADRLVVDEVLKYNNADLKVVLPLCPEEYLKDFSSATSRDEFNSLLQKADDISAINKIQLEGNIPDELLPDAKKQAYEDAGRYIVNHCDVLIAIWDELPSQGKGGTAGIVQYAKTKECPLYIINPNSPGEINFIEGNGIDKNLFRQINNFNNFNAGEELWTKCTNENLKQFFINKETEDEYDLPEHNKTIVKELLLPYYTHSEIFAVKSQKLYRYIGLIVFWLSFLSVAVVGYGEIFFEHIPRYIFMIELFFLVIISLLIFLSHKQATHRNYVDNRFLAEHLRTDIILTLCGVKLSPPQYVRHIKSTYMQNGWMILVLEHILSQIPELKSFTDSNIQIFKNYIRKVWIKSQIDYHRQRIKDAWNKNEKLEFWGETIFYLAVIIAVIHVLFTIELHEVERILVFAVLLLPALGATTGAIKTHRDYKKIITDSTIILNELENLDYEFGKPLSKHNLHKLIRKAEKIMRSESEDWLTLLASKELEKAV